MNRKKAFKLFTKPNIVFVHGAEELLLFLLSQALNALRSLDKIKLQKNK
jgi:hypothetical protein